MIKSFVLILFLKITLFLFSGCQEKAQNQITIAAASNLQFVIKDLVKSFELKSGKKCELIIGSSGKITAQVIQGAPYEIFLSADMKYPNQLYSDGYAVDMPVIYALGKLVLWSKNKDLTKLENLVEEKVKKIAIANPGIAPYGKAAMETISFQNLTQELSSKLVYGENVAQATQFIVSGNTEAGFISKSIAITLNDGYWTEVNSENYSKIEQGFVLLKNYRPAAREFIDYLLSEEGQKILKKHGYEAITK